MNSSINVREIRVLRGPNVWSVSTHKIIEIKVFVADLRKIENVQAGLIIDTIRFVAGSSGESVPSMPVDESIHPRDPAMTIGQACLLLQAAAGMNTQFTASRFLEVDNAFLLAFAYELPEAGRFALDAVLQLMTSSPHQAGAVINETIAKLQQMKSEFGLGPSTGSIATEALRRGIPVIRLDNSSALQLGFGRYQRRITATIADSTSALATDLAGDKAATKERLAGARIPTPEGRVIHTIDDLVNVVEELGYPLVIKPLDGNHGRGVTTGIRTLQQAIAAYRMASEISDEVIVERFIVGDDYRLLVVDYKLAAAAKRIPASVTGDGRSTIRQLVEEINREPERADGHAGVLTRISIDQSTLDQLKEKNLTPESILPEGEIVKLKPTANISSGGTAEDVTSHVHPFNVHLAERIARVIGLDICGIDLIAGDITRPVNDENAAVVEVNAAPGLRMHLAPAKGAPVNVAEPIVRMLFPAGKPSRIPIVAITGTNGKTTTTRLVAHLASLAGNTVGYCTTDGIFVGSRMIESGDCSGPSSAGVILGDSTVDFAVLECARGGLLRSGLGFDHCSTSIITNITEDHLGLGNIHTLEDLAHVKSVVAKTTMNPGYAILNSEDDLVYANYHQLDCKKALFGLEMNDRIRQHCAEGGLAATVHNGYFTIWQGDRPVPVIRVEEVPLTLGGHCEAMISNVLPAMLAAVAEELPLDILHHGLLSFRPSADQTPGRMNIFELGEVRVLLDYAHNPAGFTMLKKFLQHTPATCKLGIIGGTGDRRDQDIVRIGAIAAEMFDRIIIRHDKDGRGRTNEEITRLLERGIGQADTPVPFEIISDEEEALATALDAAMPGCLIVLCSDQIEASIGYLNRAVEAMNNNVEVV